MQFSCRPEWICFSPGIPECSGIFWMSTNLIPDRCNTESSCPEIDLFFARNFEPSGMDLFFTRNHPEFQKHIYEKRDISYI